MQPVRRVAGRMAPLDLADVDTDQIIPKQFLKRIERTGYGPFLFYDWRARGNFVLDKPEYEGAPVLVAGANFGCGSSREQGDRRAELRRHFPRQLLQDRTARGDPAGVAGAPPGRPGL